MRLNKYLALSLGISRRAADKKIDAGVIAINSRPAALGSEVSSTDKVTVDGKPVKPKELKYLLMNKPVGYICSRQQQGKSKTIYSLLPAKYHHLNSVGRLDKESSGLLLLTNDGHLAQQLTHPRHHKTKVYLVQLNKALSADDLKSINKGVELADGISHLKVEQHNDQYCVSMHEGRNRQIRRTFAQLGYMVTQLERIQFGQLKLSDLKDEIYLELSPDAAKRTVDKAF